MTEFFFLGVQSFAKMRKIKIEREYSTLIFIPFFSGKKPFNGGLMGNFK